MIYTYLADNLKRLREARGLTQKDISDAIGVDRSTYAQYEASTANPKMATLYKMIAFFDITFFELLEDPKLIESGDLSDETRRIPIVGEINCGSPLEVEQNIEDYIYLDREDPDIENCYQYYAVRASGSSMEPEIFPGDLLVVNSDYKTPQTGDAVIALVNGASTFKIIDMREPGFVQLIPFNKSFPIQRYDLREKEVIIQGKVIKIIKKAQSRYMGIVYERGDEEPEV